MKNAPAGYTVDELVALVNDARANSQEERDLARKCESYYDGDQWTANERKVLNERGQPIVTSNKVRKKVNAYLGLEQERRADPKARARSQKLVGSAEVATRLLRANMDAANFERVKSKCFRDGMVSGTMAVAQGIKIVGGQPQTFVKRIRFEDFIFDTRAYEDDFSDAQFLGYGRYMSKKQVKRFFPDADIDRAFDGARQHEGDDLADPQDETSHRTYWYNKKLERAYVVQLYYLVGDQWMYCTFTSGGKLEEGDSPYINDRGDSIAGVTAQSIYVGVDLDRHGPVKDMLPLQDELNKRRSKMLAALSARQSWAAEHVFANVTKARKEMAKLDGHWEPAAGTVKGQDWDVLENTFDFTGNARLYEVTEKELDAQGANPGLTGRGTQYSSGRAIQAQIQSGLREEAEIFDALRVWELRVYAMDWFLTRQFYTDQRVVRVIGRDDVEKFIPINEPQVKMTPRGPVAFLKNAPMMMDVDWTLDTTPDSATLRQEQFTALMEILGKTPPQLWDKMLPVVMMLGEFTQDTKDAVMQLVGGTPQQQQMQAAAQQIDMQERQAEVAKKQADVGLAKAREMDVRANAFLKMGRGYGTLPEQQLERAEMGLKAQELRNETQRGAMDFAFRRAEQARPAAGGSSGE